MTKTWEKEPEPERVGFGDSNMGAGDTIDVIVAIMVHGHPRGRIDQPARWSVDSVIRCGMIGAHGLSTVVAMADNDADHAAIVIIHVGEKGGEAVPSYCVLGVVAAKDHRTGAPGGETAPDLYGMVCTIEQYTRDHYSGDPMLVDASDRIYKH